MNENMKFIWPYARHYKKDFLIMLVSILLTSLSGVLYPLFLGEMINSILYERKIDRFMVCFGGYGLFFVIQQLMRYLNTKKYAILETIFLYDIRKDVLKNVFNQPTSFLNSMDRGDIISRVEKDVHEILDYIYFNVFYTFSDFFEFISQIILILLINWKLLFLTFISMPLSFGLRKLCIKYGELCYKKRFESEGKFSGWIFQIINCLLDIRLLSGEQKVISDFEHKKERLNGIKQEVSQIEVFTEIGIEGTGVLLKVMLYIVSAILVIRKELLIGSFISVIEYFNSALEIFNDMAGRANPITENMVAIARVRELISSENGTLSLIQKPSDEKAIIFENVSFSYEGTKEDVLKDISFCIKRGEHVAVAGRSGGGKTTLFKLLLGFYIPNNGKIFMNDSDIGAMFQNTTILDGSLRFNLIFSDDEEQDERIWDLLEELDLAEVVKKLPNGLETQMNSQDIPFSGGQIQRIGIIRALLKEPEILLFDEPTSAFDAVSEENFIKMCDRSLAKKTIIMISHRLKTLQLADKIIFLYDGEIDGVGTHAELLQDNLKYREYVNEVGMYAAEN